MSQSLAPSLRQVAVTDIALDDHTFQVTYRPDMTALQRSVAQVGVLTPVHLRQRAEHAPLQVVCGRKRLLACQHTGCPSVPALVHQVEALSDLQAWLLVLHDNLGCRQLNVVEKGRLLLHLRPYAPTQPATWLHDVCRLLELPPRDETLETYCRLAVVPEPLQTAVVEEGLPVETALWISTHAAVDGSALQELFTRLKVGTNRARELATYLDEICQRDACRPAELLQALGLSPLLEDARLTGPQKLDNVRRLIRQARYPQLSTYEQRFQEALRHLRLPPQISLRPPPYFEGQQYQVTLNFRQPQELQHYAQRLLDAAGHEALERLLELL